MKQLRLLFYTVIIISIAMISTGCIKKADHTLRKEARDLYLKSLALNTKYIDSISRCRDTATLLGIAERYDHALTALNYKYPAGTDYEVSEGENDTLKNLTMKFITVRDSLLMMFSKQMVAADSLATDSVKQAQAGLNTLISQ